MKKLLLTMIIGYLIAFSVSGPLHAASYYGCASASINADSTFCATPSGSCAGSDPVTAATALQAGNDLYANGCTISIADSFTATKISTEDGDGAGAAVSGGGFTAATATVSGKTITTDIVSGTSVALTVTGSTAGTPVFTIAGSATGGSGSNIYGIFLQHTVGTVAVGGSGKTFTGGTASGTHGLYNGSAGPMTVTGDGVANYGAGVQHGGTGAATMTGNCTGGGTYNISGCAATSSGYLSVTGNIINGSAGVGATGRIRYTPGASNYVKFDGGGTAVYLSLPPAADKILTTGSFVNSADGTVDSGTATAGGGGGAWAN